MKKALKLGLLALALSSQGRSFTIPECMTFSAQTCDQLDAKGAILYGHDSSATGQGDRRVEVGSDGSIKTSVAAGSASSVSLNAGTDTTMIGGVNIKEVGGLVPGVAGTIPITLYDTAGTGINSTALNGSNAGTSLTGVLTGSVIYGYDSNATATNRPIKASQHNVALVAADYGLNTNGNLKGLNGVAVSVGNGTTDTGTQRVSLSSDSTGLVKLATGANTIGALTANQSVNNAQVNGTTTDTNNGATSAGTQRVTLSNDSTGQVRIADSGGNQYGSYNNGTVRALPGVIVDPASNNAANVSTFGSTSLTNALISLLTDSVAYGMRSTTPVPFTILGTLTDGNTNTTTNTLGTYSYPYQFNGTSWDRIRSNMDTLTAVASGAYTTTQTQADTINYNARGITVALDMTVVGTGSVTLEIDWKEPVSGKYIALLTGAAVVTNSTNIYTVYPGVTVVANSAASTVLPRTFRIKVTANNANSATYSVGYALSL